MLTHYIIVRRDLPLGVLAAMITHAAGESAHFYEDERGGFRGATAVVLEVKNEHDLLKAEELLYSNYVQYVVVSESSPPYTGQSMAIGLVPCERDKVKTMLEPYQTLKRLDIEEPHA